MNLQSGARGSDWLRRICPHCGTHFNRALDPAVYADTHSTDETKLTYSGPRTCVGKTGREEIYIFVYECPRCGKETIDLHRHPYKRPQETSILTIDPLLPSREVAEEVPAELRDDFVEAVRVSSLSSKASATLSRRCLQSTLRYCFPEMPHAELFSEIRWLEKQGKLPLDIFSYLHSLRKAGNFGAHPSKKGLSIVYDLSAEDLEACFLVLQTLFDLLIVLPARQQRTLEALKSNMLGGAKSEGDHLKSPPNTIPATDD